MTTWKFLTLYFIVVGPSKRSWENGDRVTILRQLKTLTYPTIFYPNMKEWNFMLHQWLFYSYFFYPNAHRANIYLTLFPFNSSYTLLRSQERLQNSIWPLNPYHIIVINKYHAFNSSMRVYPTLDFCFLQASPLSFFLLILPIVCSHPWGMLEIYLYDYTMRSGSHVTLATMLWQLNTWLKRDRGWGRCTKRSPSR